MVTLGKRVICENIPMVLNIFKKSCDFATGHFAYVYDRYNHNLYAFHNFQKMFMLMTVENCTQLHYLYCVHPYNNLYQKFLEVDHQE